MSQRRARLGAHRADRLGLLQALRVGDEDEILGEIAASMLPAAYHMLKNGVEYRIWVPSTSRAAVPPKSFNGWFDDLRR